MRFWKFFSILFVFLVPGLLFGKPALSEEQWGICFAHSAIKMSNDQQQVYMRERMSKSVEEITTEF